MTNQKPLSEERLAEIEARATKATEGPWHVASPIYSLRHFLSSRHDEIAAFDFEYGDDADFCAHARADIDALTVEVRRLRALVAESRRLFGKVVDYGWYEHDITSGGLECPEDDTCECEWVRDLNAFFKASEA